MSWRWPPMDFSNSWCLYNHCWASLNSFKKSVALLFSRDKSCKLPPWVIVSCWFQINQAWTKNSSNSSVVSFFSSSSINCSTSSCPPTLFYNHHAHPHKAWIADSESLLHRVHVPSSIINLQASFSRVGKMPWQARHAKIRTLFGMWSFHSLPHMVLLPTNEGLSPLTSFSLLSSLAKWYPAFTENSSFVECNQNRVSLVCRRLSGIREIASAFSRGNLRSSSRLSQSLIDQSISSETCHLPSTSTYGCNTLLVG